MVLLLTKKRAGALQAAGCLPACRGPGLLLTLQLQPDSASHVGNPVHYGNLGPQEGSKVRVEERAVVTPD